MSCRPDPPTNSMNQAVLPSMLYNKIFDQSDRIKILAFNARTVGNLPHNHPVEIFKPLPKEKEKAIHLIHTEKSPVNEIVNKTVTMLSNPKSIRKHVFTASLTELHSVLHHRTNTITYKNIRTNTRLPQTLTRKQFVDFVSYV